MAGISSISLCGTGGSGNNRLVIMSVGGNRGLCNENLATSRALFALGESGCGTSGGDGIKNSNAMIAMVVRQFGYHIGFKMIAICTIATLLALGGLGGLFGYNPLAKVVPLGGNSGLCYQNFFTYRTVLAFG